MIAFFDTSAIVPLLVHEASSDLCHELWRVADIAVGTQLAYVETAAALARATRLARMSHDDHAESRTRLDRIWDQLDVMPVDDVLVREAASLTRDHPLRGYDAVHCAAALRLVDLEVTAITGDRVLLTAWHDLGIAVVDTLA